MIAACSPQARGRREWMFSTHQCRLPKELVLAGITTMEGANRYLREDYWPNFNAEFMRSAMEEGSAFVPFFGELLEDILFCVSVMSAQWATITVFSLGSNATDTARSLPLPLRESQGDGVALCGWGMALCHGPHKLTVYDAHEKKVFQGNFKGAA